MNNMRWIQNVDQVVILSVAKNLVGPCARSFVLLRMIILLIITLFMGGCGSNRFPVAGEVTFDGKPVEQGTISLEPVDRQGPTTGGKIINGKYRLEGDAAPLPGKKTVRISASRKTGRKISAGSLAQKGEMVEEIERYIPDIYNKKTTLTCEIGSQATNQIDFHLKSPSK